MPAYEHPDAWRRENQENLEELTLMRNFRFYIQDGEIQRTNSLRLPNKAIGLFRHKRAAVLYQEAAKAGYTLTIAQAETAATDLDQVWALRQCLDCGNKFAPASVLARKCLNPHGGVKSAAPCGSVRGLPSTVAWLEEHGATYGIRKVL